MVYRKGELSKSQIDRHWPHQIALPAHDGTGQNFVAIRLFCESLSLCPRGHFFYRAGVGFNVYCFAERAHADQFRERFGGELIDPKNRPRWPK